MGISIRYESRVAQKLPFGNRNQVTFECDFESIKLFIGVTNNDAMCSRSLRLHTVSARHSGKPQAGLWENKGGFGVKTGIALRQDGDKAKAPREAGLLKFCAEGAFHWTRSPSTCLPYHRRGRLPEQQPWARGFPKPWLRWSASGRRWRPRSAGQCALPSSGR